MRSLGFGLAVLLAAAQQIPVSRDAGYVDSDVCARCHQEIARTYRQTGMGRSFYAAKPEPKATFYHPASDRHYTMYARDGRFYQRRHQLASDGSEQNVVEKEIHYVMGSGNRARTYLHKTAGGELIQLPVGWYSERGGFWAMSPGYDRPDQVDFRRKVDRECFFCHNAYPAAAVETFPGQRELAIPGKIPEGIDCQRCHGPGRNHVQLAQSAAPPDAIQQAVVNPARLPPERQLEVCLQCHLESTSHRLPYAIRRYGRDYFSYRPGEPLADYITHFDRARKSESEEGIEIVHSAYRLFQSACFRQSSGTITCTTCHNPHGQDSPVSSVQACRGCHAAALDSLVKANRHPASNACVECHMPQRRTTDVVNAVMTDHKIARHKPTGNPLAPRNEIHDTDATAYKGEVALLYPQTIATPLYLDLAQVIDGANVKGGLPRLERSIARVQPKEAGFYFELANAYVEAGQNQKAFRWYEEALQREPKLLPARIKYAAALTAAGRANDAIRLLEPAPSGATALNTLGSAYLNAGRIADAIATFRRAIDSDIPEIHVNLGAALSRQGDRAAAIDAMRTAIRLAPDFAAAHNNLGNLLSEAGDFSNARQAFQTAIRLNPAYVEAHYNFGRSLAVASMLEAAEAEFRAALKLNPNMAEAAISLGLILARQERMDEAIAQYRETLRRNTTLVPARFNLGLALMRQGKNALAKEQFEVILETIPNDYETHYHLGMILLAEGAKEAAKPHLQKASASPNSELRRAAQNAIGSASRK